MRLVRLTYSLTTKLALGTLVSMSMLAACGTAPPAAEPVPLGDYRAVTRQLETFIEQQARSSKVAGLSIALVDDQRVVWAHGTGWADAAAQRPAGPDTLYRMGSISKLFTDVAAMQLVVRGRLNLDAPLQQALPSFGIPGRQGDAPITARQLMDHHAGLTRDVQGGMWGKPVGDFRTMVDRLTQEDALLPPGLMFSYSNVGLTVLGTVVERLSGQPFEAHMQAAVLSPLGMYDSSFSAAVPDAPLMARAYLSGELQDEPSLRDVPAGGLTASVTDMARFISMVFAQGRNAEGETVLPPPQIAEMLRVQNGDVPLDVGFNQGLGWMLSTFDRNTVHGGGPVAHHSGATFYFRSQLMLLPAHRVGVIVASNDSAAGDAVNRIAQRALALMLEAKTGVRQAEPVPGYRPSSKPWSDGTRQACVGEYLTPAGVVNIDRNGDGLRVRVADRSLEAVEGEEAWAGLRYKLAGLIPVSLGMLSDLGVQCRTVNGRAVLVGRLDGQELMIGDRLPPTQAALPPSYATLVGRYEPVLLPGERATLESVEVQVDGGRLWAQARLAKAFGGQTTPRLPMRAVSDDEALLIGPLAEGGEIVRRRRGEDGGEQLVAAGSTFRKVSP